MNRCRIAAVTAWSAPPACAMTASTAWELADSGNFRRTIRTVLPVTPRWVVPPLSPVNAGTHGAEYTESGSWWALGPHATPPRDTPPAPAPGAPGPGPPFAAPPVGVAAGPTPGTGVPAAPLPGSSTGPAPGSRTRPDVAAERSSSGRLGNTTTAATHTITSA